jgi:prophage antirepressor-like protein
MDLQVFNNINFGEIQAFIGTDNNVWFIAKPLSDRLGYSKTNNMLKLIPKKNKKLLKDVAPNTLESLSGSYLEGDNDFHKLRVINEPGFYKAIAHSKKKEAEKFQDWVYEEVLPSIRKYGFYNPNIPAVKERVVVIQRHHDQYHQTITANSLHLMLGVPKAYTIQYMLDKGVAKNSYVPTKLGIDLGFKQVEAIQGGKFMSIPNKFINDIFNFYDRILPLKDNSIVRDALRVFNQTNNIPLLTLPDIKRNTSSSYDDGYIEEVLKLV